MIEYARKNPYQTANNTTKMNPRNFEDLKPTFIVYGMDL